jgi:RloB-like protein
MARARGRDSVHGTTHASRRQRVIYVFTEGTLTEPCYIDWLKEFKDEQAEKKPSSPGEVPVRISIEWDERTHSGRRGPARSKYHRKPLELVRAAVKLKREKENEARGWAKKYWPTVWCLFDRDDHNGVNEAVKLAKGNEIQVAYSHPCFELWRLLHYQNYTSTFGGVCGEASARLKAQPAFVESYGPGNRKVSDEQAKLVLPEQLRGRYAAARKHAMKINAQPASPDRERWDPYTDVWRFVDEGIGLTDY